MNFSREFYQVRNRILREILATSVARASLEKAYQAAAANYIDNLPTLSPSDRLLVDLLEQEGIVTTSLAALAIPSASLIFDTAKSLLPTIPRTTHNQKNQFVVHATSAQIMAHPELFLWGLEERLLNIVENYLGLPVAYHGLYFRRDIANKIRAKSRLWHLDGEDRRMLKIIIYLNDVSDDGGPFQYIPKHLTSTVSSAFNYRCGYLQDEMMKSVIPSFYWKACTGLAGTVLFVDTASVFHRGEVPIASDRFTLFFDYTSRRPKYPFDCKSSLSRDELLKLVPRLSARQKECIFWRNHLQHLHLI